MVLGLRHSADGFTMRAKVGVQQTNHQLIRPVGGWQGNNNYLLSGGAMCSGLFAMGLCPLRFGEGNGSNTGHNLLGVSICSSGCCGERLGHLDKPCLSSSSTLPFLRRRGLRE
jgi:hypothetical protein